MHDNYKLALQFNQTGSGAHQTSYLMGTGEGGSFPCGKAVGA